MSILDTDSNILNNMDNYIKEQSLTEFAWASLLAANVSVIEAAINPTWKKIVQTWNVDEGSSMFVSQMVEYLQKENTPFNPMLRSMLGRPVYSIDCRYLCKGDALHWLEAVSNTQNELKPILVIENITKIPEEDAQHDNPQYLRNILMHSWKNQANDFINVKTGNSFCIKPADYTVFITFAPGMCEEMNAIYEPSNGFAWVGNYEEYIRKFVDDFKDQTLPELEKKHILEYR